MDGRFPWEPSVSWPVDIAHHGNHQMIPEFVIALTLVAEAGGLGQRGYGKSLYHNSQQRQRRFRTNGKGMSETPSIFLLAG